MAGIPTNLPPDGLEVLVFENSPYGNLDAIVQQDGRAVYLYLSRQSTGSDQDFVTRACWVRNLQQGPYVLNEDEMRQGIAPMLPRTHCKSVQPGRLPQPDDLKIVWFEEGNGVALLERRDVREQFETLAVIPPWSGMDNFVGYAAECASESPLCWPLPSNPKLKDRIDRADEFWNSFRSKPDPFATLQSAILESYRARWSTDSIGDPTYYSIDGGRFPPRGMVHYRTAQHHVLATVAMSLCPQPLVELFVENPRNARRIELAIEIGQDTSDEILDNARQTLSRLAGYPWNEFTWLGHGHTCQFAGVLPNVETVRLVNDVELNGENAVEFSTFRSDPIQLLWLQPLDGEQELDLASNTKTG